MASTLALVVAVALAVTLTTTSANLAADAVELDISTISAAPAVLPGAPLSASPELAPDVSPLFPSPVGGSAVAPAGSLPTIPSEPSPPNPDAVVAPGPTSAASPTGSFTAMAASKSAAAALGPYRCSSVYIGCIVVMLGLHQLLGDY